MATRKRVTDIVKQRFQYHRQWGTEDHGWNLDTSSKKTPVLYLGDYAADTGHQSGSDAPTGTWTASWFLDCTAKMWAAINEDDPSDLNVYVEVEVSCKHNKLWTSNDVQGDGFIDIGAIYFNPSERPRGMWTHNGSQYLYFNNMPASRNQLENDIGAASGSWIAGVVTNTSSREGRTIVPKTIANPEGWGCAEATYVNGIDTPWSSGNNLKAEIVFTPEDYDDEGHLIIDDIAMPFYIAVRYWSNTTEVTVELNKLFDFNIIGDNPFQYVPWAARNGSGNWISCDEHRNGNNEKNGLLVRKNGSWSHLVVNNPLNPKVPGDSNGFRVVDQTKTGLKKWGVSPKTPSDS